MAMASGALRGGEVVMKDWGFPFYHRVLSSFSLKPSSSASSSSSWRRSLSSSTTDAVAEAVDGEGGEEKKKATRKRRKKRNLIEVARYLPNWGIGYLMTRSIWSSSTSYKITKINLYKDGKHGKAWGIFHKNGLPCGRSASKLSGVNKYGWKYILEPEAMNDSKTSTTEKSFSIVEPKMEQDSETADVEKSSSIPEPKTEDS